MVFKVFSLKQGMHFTIYSVLNKCPLGPEAFKRVLGLAMGGLHVHVVPTICFHKSNTIVLV